MLPTVYGLVGLWFYLRVICINFVHLVDKSPIHTSMVWKTRYIIVLAEPAYKIENLETCVN